MSELTRADIAKLLERWLHSGCPDCLGDCASANPPVTCCIVRETYDALRSLSAPEREGWVSVPKEPTREMLAAALGKPGLQLLNMDRLPAGQIVKIWSTMLAALSNE